MKNDNPINMTIEILKQAFKEAITEVQQEEKDKTTVLTAHEAADILRINKRTLLNRIHSGKYELLLKDTNIKSPYTI